jgi:hypothetical protein
LAGEEAAATGRRKLRWPAARESGALEEDESPAAAALELSVAC